MSTVQQPAQLSCPKCGNPMRLRLASRGPNAGRYFWGCSGYPVCKETIAARPEDQPMSADEGHANRLIPCPQCAGSGKDTRIAVSQLLVGNSADAIARWQVTQKSALKSRMYRDLNVTVESAEESNSRKCDICSGFGKCYLPEIGTARLAYGAELKGFNIAREEFWQQVENIRELRSRLDRIESLTPKIGSESLTEDELLELNSRFSLSQKLAELETEIHGSLAGLAASAIRVVAVDHLRRLAEPPVDPLRTLTEDSGESLNLPFASIPEQELPMSEYNAAATVPRVELLVDVDENSAEYATGLYGLDRED